MLPETDDELEPLLVWVTLAMAILIYAFGILCGVLFLGDK